MQIEVENLSITFTQDQSEMIALKDVSLGIEKGEFICLLGPSGCGKSTLLNTMAGFLKPTEGTVKIDGKEVVHPSISYVTIFQNYGLLPWRNVEKNVALGLETKKVPKEERKKIIKKYIDLVGLSGSEKKRSCGDRPRREEWGDWLYCWTKTYRLPLSSSSEWKSRMSRVAIHWSFIVRNQRSILAFPVGVYGWH